MVTKSLSESDTKPLSLGSVTDYFPLIFNNITIPIVIISAISLTTVSYHSLSQLFD